jgi:hypothetical protein
MTQNRLDYFISLGISGRSEDIDLLMQALITQNDLATFKLVDFALSHVSTTEGVQRLRYYLFQGLRPQRNYAALYFKRRGFVDTLQEALNQGAIDWEQGFAS